MEPLFEEAKQQDQKPKMTEEKGMDEFIRKHESEKWRVPGERYAYGGDDVLLDNYKYYIPGDLQRILAKREIRVKSK